MNNAVLFSKASDEWATPQGLVDALSMEFRFTRDVAATASNRKCVRWFGPGSPDAEDALTVPWLGCCWMNPPYSRCREFIAKAYAEMMAGHALTVALVPSRTDTRWWHDYVWDERVHQTRPGVSIRFLRGRVKFDGAAAGAPFPSMLIVFHLMWEDEATP